MSSPHAYNEQELLQRIATDDAEAFSMLYKHYWQPLFTLAAKMLRSEDEAADILQDVFMSLWRRRKESKIEGSLAGYLHNSVRYKVRDHIAKNITKRDYLALLTDTALYTLPASSPILLELKEVQQVIHTTVTKMPARMQQAYRLRREQQLSYNEIAQEMNTSPETARKQVQNALQLIKTALGNSGTALIVVLSHLLR